MIFTCIEFLNGIPVYLLSEIYGDTLKEKLLIEDGIIVGVEEE